ncbi:MAG: prolyl oligopeptidase family serine peptidase [Pirellulales bacterium]|nr:prolyl oligopeptidase family serine peptidase [Pirellulales bacterium]
MPTILRFRYAGSLPMLLLVALVARPSPAADEPCPCKVIDDVVYGHKDGLALTLDVVTPEKNAKGLGVILVSSGGWHSDKSDIPARNLKRMNEEHWVQGLLKGGYTLFIARHGSGPRYHVPEMVEDIRRAVRFVRLHAKDYGVDPEHLGITSGSSGGHLSLMVGLTADDGHANSEDLVERASSRVQAIVSWFPPTDLVNWRKPGGYTAIVKARPGMFEEMFGEITDIEAQLKSISPIEFVSTDDPPLLLLHGDLDLVVPLQQSEVLRDKYVATKLPVKLIVHHKGMHSEWPGIMDDYPAVWEWFDKYLGNEASKTVAE